MIFTVDCDWDYGIGRMGGEYYFAVERKPSNPGFVVRIAYLPAYYWDCGVPAQRISLCHLSASCDPHTGDSEFIIVDVRYDPSSNHWVTQTSFLSAHCLTSADGDCRWWDRASFQWVDAKRYGAPVVWVAERKHANYYSLGQCQTGGFAGFDTCEFNSAGHRFPIVYTQQNIGSRATPLRDCAPPFWSSQLTNPQAIECMWNTTQRSRFDGWQGFSSGAPAQLYGNLLSTFAAF